MPIEQRQLGVRVDLIPMPQDRPSSSFIQAGLAQITLACAPCAGEFAEPFLQQANAYRPYVRHLGKGDPVLQFVVFHESVMIARGEGATAISSPF